MPTKTIPEWLLDDNIPLEVRKKAYQMFMIERQIGGILLGRQEVAHLCLFAASIGLVSVAVLVGFERPALLIALGLFQAGFSAWGWVEFNKRQADAKASLKHCNGKLQTEGWDYYSGSLRKLEA